MISVFKNSKKYSVILLSVLGLSLFSSGTAQVAERPVVGPGHYPNPGIIALRNGQWVGSDHLYNLSPNLDVEVEIFTPPHVVLPVSKGEIQATIESIFEKARIVPHTVVDEGKPPLPFFHMLIMAHPIEKGFVVYCEGRLFEKVNLERVSLDPQTAIQAVTWESQNLIVAAKDKVAEQILSNVSEIATSFADRFRFYEDIRMQLQRR